MPRTGRRRSLTIAAALAAVLAAPAAAQAATYTVGAHAGDGACGGADLACGDLSDAATAAAPGDVFNVSPGTYGSTTFTVGGITLAGAPTFTVNGSLAFTGNGGSAVRLQHVALSQQNGSNAGVISTGAAGVEIDDSVIASPSGDGVTFSAGTANKIVRSVVVTGGATTAAVRVTSADLSTDSKKLTIESSIVSGGAAGVSVNTGEGNGLVSHPGDVALVLHHVTAADSSNSLVLDGSKANPLIGGPYGNITADVTDSILENGTAKIPYLGVLGTLTLTAPPNTQTDTYVRTLQAPFDANAVFENPAAHNFRLKAGSPAIGKGGVTPGESTTDIDGQDRSTAPTDLGADEYVAPTPTTPPPPPPGTVTDGTPPAVVISKPTAGQRIHITTVTTKTKTVTKKGKKVKVKTKTSKPTKISISGTAKDASGVKAVVLTVQKISTTVSTPKKTASKAKASQTTTTTPAQKCKWLNATKGIVVKSCNVPILLLAKLNKDGTWVFDVKSTIKLGAGKYRVIVIGADNSGAAGNSAAKADAIRTFTLIK
jgi:hypothetical protein